MGFRFRKSTKLMPGIRVSPNRFRFAAVASRRVSTMPARSMSAMQVPAGRSGRPDDGSRCIAVPGDASLRVDRLEIRPSTVHTHIESALRKLECSIRTRQL